VTSSDAARFLDELIDFVIVVLNSYHSVLLRLNGTQALCVGNSHGHANERVRNCRYAYLNISTQI
jgi:hypothetical protein